MSEKEIRRAVHEKKYWFFSASVPNGPAHIVGDHRLTLCGSTYNTREYTQATHMCKRCAKIAAKLFELPAETQA